MGPGAPFDPMTSNFTEFEVGGTDPACCSWTGLTGGDAAFERGGAIERVTGVSGG